jgi:hypothetical protein
MKLHSKLMCNTLFHYFPEKFIRKGKVTVIKSRPRRDLFTPPFSTKYHETKNTMVTTKFSLKKSCRTKFSAARQASIPNWQKKGRKGGSSPINPQIKSIVFNCSL